MSTSTVVKKILQSWDVPPEDRSIISRVMEGLDAEQRKIVLAALEGLDAEQRKRLARILEDPEKLERLLASLEG